MNGFGKRSRQGDAVSLTQQLPVAALDVAAVAHAANCVAAFAFYFYCGGASATVMLLL